MVIKASAADMARRAGFKSLSEFERFLGRNAKGRPVFSRTTLEDWATTRPLALECMLLGAAAKKEGAKLAD